MEAKSAAAVVDGVGVRMHVSWELGTIMKMAHINNESAHLWDRPLALELATSMIQTLLLA